MHSWIIRQSDCVALGAFYSYVMQFIMPLYINIGIMNGLYGWCSTLYLHRGFWHPGYCNKDLFFEIEASARHHEKCEENTNSQRNKKASNT